MEPNHRTRCPQNQKIPRPCGILALRWRDPDSNRGHHDFQSCGAGSEVWPICREFLRPGGVSPVPGFPGFCVRFSGVTAHGGARLSFRSRVLAPGTHARVQRQRLSRVVRSRSQLRHRARYRSQRRSSVPALRALRVPRRRRRNPCRSVKARTAEGGLTPRRPDERLHRQSQLWSVASDAPRR